MLVLSRKIGEEIFVGADICIRVIESERGKVRLGIFAPKELRVYRGELITEIVKTNILIEASKGHSTYPELNQ